MENTANAIGLCAQCTAKSAAELYYAFIANDLCSLVRVPVYLQAMFVRYIQACCRLFRGARFRTITSTLSWRIWLKVMFLKLNLILIGYNTPLII